MTTKQSDNRKAFEQYKLIHNFYYDGEPLKKWINEDNYKDLFKEDWNVLMDVIGKISKLRFPVGSKKEIKQITALSGIGECASYADISGVYETIIEFIKWYNENKEQ